MLIAACQTTSNAKHGSFPVLKPTFSLSFLKKSCWSQIAKQLRMWSMARFLFWNLHFPQCFWRIILIAACQTAPNEKHGSFPVLQSAFSLVFLKKPCWSQLAKPLRMRSMARFLFWNLQFPYSFEEIMLIEACQTAPNAKHGSFSMLKPAFSLVFLKKSCWSQLAKPLRMQNIACFLCWNLHCPSIFEEIMAIAAYQTAPNAKHASFPVLKPACSHRSECEAWLVSCFETCIFRCVFEEIMLIAACQIAPNAKHCSFPALKPALFLACLKKPCWSQLAKPLRMRSIASFMFWNLRFP